MDIPASSRATTTDVGMCVAEREIAEGRDAERERDRQAGEDRERHHAEEEDDEIDAAEAQQIRARKIEDAAREQTQPPA